ncbi:glycosyltransferase [Rhodopseudomonas sp. HC1]|uniref:class I SAM-dependent methyltransferase n=1 Tax=Rhodopseudomonas infernalis TaxID=2897386 RepID=UPI001EE89B24|nr:glycosyltransferase [Rhodopseudomonas infernalis]MCG6205221.1 glycosyltransferase [Rhodopseudomonas infernalis]
MNLDRTRNARPAFISQTSTWRPSYLPVSAWLEHGAFGFWVVEATSPGLVVELGTDYGFSYLTFCQAIKGLNLGTRAFAVDTWQGDFHAGFYGDDVLQALKQTHDSEYRGFSTLLQMTFDEAADKFADGSIDLLHIDGRHLYDDVRHDFETWLPKLSDRAVVLFHDTNVRERDFGVFRFWEEITAAYPSFEFFHGHGLGVLAVGPNQPNGMRALLEADEVERNLIRSVYSYLGSVINDRQALQSERSAFQQEKNKLELTIAEQHETIQRLEGDFQEQLQAQVSESTERESELIQRESELTQRLAKQAAELADTKNRLAMEAVRIHEVFSSSSWWLTAPLRRAATWVRHRRRRSPLLLQKASNITASWKPKSTDARHIVLYSGEPETPGHMYRVGRFASAAEVLGCKTTIVTDEADLIDTPPGDVLFVWRARSSDKLGKAAAAARERDASILFDVDDLMIEPEIVSVEMIDGIRSQGISEASVASHFGEVRDAFLQCDFGVAPTAYLAERMRRYQKPAVVLPNGFDDGTLKRSRRSVRLRKSRQADGLLRIGYAAGTRTHQRDFGIAVGALRRILQERDNVRLVLFCVNRDPIVRLDEFPELSGLADKIEWREAVGLADLPEEIARFDINIVPLEAGNTFCEAKSELKYFEAALVSVPTVASPTNVYASAIREGVTGFLAANEDEWYAKLSRLLDDEALRTTIARDALHDSLWKYGPERRIELVSEILDRADLKQQSRPAHAIRLRDEMATRLPEIPDHRILFKRDALKEAEVTVVIPLYNYARYIEEALESVAGQSLELIDLVVVDDRSTDESQAVAASWLERNAKRFNRALLIENGENSGLARSRNVGFANSETTFVLPLDADNELMPDCATKCLEKLRHSRGAFAFPEIAKFGESEGVFNQGPFLAERFVGGNFIDAMALVRKAAWCGVGGYEHIQYGWEDYDFWCKLVELGLIGVAVPEVLARYRVHGQSMLKTQTDVAKNKALVVAELEKRHSWLRIAQ